MHVQATWTTAFKGYLTITLVWYTKSGRPAKNRRRISINIWLRDCARPKLFGSLEDIQVGVAITRGYALKSHQIELETQYQVARDWVIDQGLVPGL